MTERPCAVSAFDRDKGLYHLLRCLSRYRRIRLATESVEREQGARKKEKVPTDFCAAPVRGGRKILGKWAGT